MAKEKWMVHSKKADFDGFSKELGVSPIVSRIMRNRELDTLDKQRDFLAIDMSRLHRPELMKDMDRAVSILMQKIEEGKYIRIIGDYDIDGICSTYILFKGISSAGGQVSYDIPDRVKDGYGINEAIIKKAYEDGVDTIITCDNGIAAIEQIAYAKNLGMTVIVTDHHEVPFEEDVETGQRVYKRVCADATVNPKQPDCNYPFKLLCGGAVAYKVIERLFDRLGLEQWIEESEIFIQLASIATIGDVVELVGENRVIAAEGLKRVRHTENIGLNSLLDACSVNREKLSSYHIGFVVGPCLNATGRLESAKKGLELLLCNEQQEADRLAAELVELNQVRKQMTEESVEKAISLAKDKNEDRVLVLYLQDTHESIAGIVAGRVRDRYNKSVFIITDSADKGEDNVAKGSGRAIEGYNMFEELTKCSHMLIKYGGHEMAAGFSLKKDDIDNLSNRLNLICSLTEDDMVKKVWIDVPMPLAYATKSLVNELAMLEPFGKGNEKPVFATKNVKLKSLRIMGANQNMCKMNVDDGSGKTVEALVFQSIYQGFMEFITEKFGVDEVRKAKMSMANNIELSLIYYPDINEYNGRETEQIIVNNYC